MIAMASAYYAYDTATLTRSEFKQQLENTRYDASLEADGSLILTGTPNSLEISAVEIIPQFKVESISAPTEEELASVETLKVTNPSGRDDAGRLVYRVQGVVQDICRKGANIQRCASSNQQFAVQVRYTVRDLVRSDTASTHEYSG
ncbi:MAG: hypothetical protein AAFR53_02645 [Pseudomonadota bacterium]